MSETILVSRGGEFLRIPRAEWEAELAGAPAAMKKRLAFMTGDHHRVRRYVVREIPRRGAAIARDAIASDLALPPVRVTEILDDLERNLFFLVRRDENAVSWAFPVTADRTPHALAFESGERCYAA